MDLELKDTHVYLTGSSGGIGIETSKLLLEEGCNISLHYNTNKTPLNALGDEFPNQVFMTKADVLKEKEVILSVKESIDKFGCIQTMVINHGIWISDKIPLWKMSLKQWNNTLEVDLTGSFLFAREYLKQLQSMEKNIPNISLVFIGSTAGKFGEANHTDYSSSKAALMYGMTNSLKNEIIRIYPTGRVNCVMPGWVVTPMAEEVLNDDSAFDKVLKTIALEKVAKSFDVAASIAFLISDKMSGHISGQIIEVSGGMEGRVLH